MYDDARLEWKGCPRAAFFLLSYRRNGVDSLPLLLADDVGINLGDTDVGVTQQLAHGADASLPQPAQPSRRAGSTHRLS